MSKKMYSLLALLVVASFILAACGPAPEPTAAPEEATEAPVAEEATEAPVAAECAYKIGFVTDVGKLRDQSFNEAGWNGVEQAAATLGLGEDCIAYIETADSADYIPNIESFISEGFTIIVTSGFAMGAATHQAGIDNPDIFFIGTDQTQTTPDFAPELLPNVTGLIFHEDVSGFLAGAVAGLMTESNVVGSVLGCPFIPPVARFEVGYYNGAKYVNPDATIRDIYHPGSLDVCFVDPEWAAETAGSLIAEGVDVLFAAGGLTGNGGLIAGCNAGIKVIGVDVDQFITLPEVEDCILTSATKDLTDSVAGLIIAATDGTFPGGEVFGPATLAPFHNFEDVIPQDVKDQLAEISALITSGEIDPCAPFTLPNGDPSNAGTFCTPVTVTGNPYVAP